MMDHFISWIEIKRDGETLCLYLTDERVFSPHGKETLLGIKGLDCLGHGAIRTFYGLKSDEGQNCEIRDFWTKEARAKMPKELRKMLKNSKTFLAHWGKMFEKFFGLGDLVYLILYASTNYKALARQLLERRQNLGADVYFGLFTRWEDFLDFDKFFHLICYAPTEYKALAWREILKSPICPFEFVQFFALAPARYKNLAWKELLNRKPDNEDLRTIIGSKFYFRGEWGQVGPIPAPPKYIEKVKKLLEAREKK